MAKRQMSEEERRVYDRLTEWAAQLDALLHMYIPDRRLMRREHRDEGRTLYRAVKNALGAEHRRFRSRRGEAAQSDAEQRWFQGTVHEAYLHMDASARASAETWFDGVVAARADIALGMSEMREVYDIPKTGADQ
ncbi:MAG: hypothetical protein ACM36C_17445 [Acidobacteriota bacterium]